MAKNLALVRTLVLDSGALIAEERPAGRAQLAAMIAAAIEEDATIVLPATVIAEAWQSRPTTLTSALASTTNAIPALDEIAAYLVGQLNGATRRSQIADAHVALQAAKRTPCVVLTSDPSDLSALLTRLGISHAVGKEAKRSTQVRIEVC